MKYKINLILVFFLIASLFGACTVRRPPDVKEFAEEALVLVEYEDITTDTDKLNIGEGCTYDDECKEGLLCGSFFWYSILDIGDFNPTIIGQITICQSSDDDICISDGDCYRFGLTGTFKCNVGQCFKLQENGEDCLINGDCVSNRCCDDGKCATACKTPVLPTPAVVICTANMPCIFGYCCNGECTAEACNVGDTCLEDSDYEPGCCYLGSYTEEKCDDGSCPPCKVEPFVPVGPVEACSTDNLCPPSEYCCHGTCTAEKCSLGETCLENIACDSGCCCSGECSDCPCPFIISPDDPK